MKYRIALIGYGGIARVHAASYLQLERAGKAKLVAVFDKNPEAFRGPIAINRSDDSQEKPEFRPYTDLDRMLSEEEIDAVDVCVPTHLHKPVTLDLLKRGYHVLCEKPMATSYEECLEMTSAAEAAGRQLMIGHCLRFSPAYAYLKEVIEDRRFGEVRSAAFERLSAPPAWCRGDWIRKKENFGTCLHDLQIHDVDMARYLFGEPEKISCRAESDGFSRFDRAHSLLHYPRHTVSLSADWSLPNFTFRSGYRVAFERATVSCTGETVTVYPTGAPAYSPEISDESSYTAEIAYFLGTLSGETENRVDPASDSAGTVRLVCALAQSAENGGISLDYSENK